MNKTFAERWYRLFLRAFPPGHRAEYGPEIIGTLLNDAPRRVPSARETAGLLTAGYAARARAATGEPMPWWADGAHLGLLMLALANLAYRIADHASLGWLAVSALLVVAFLRGWTLLALPLALAVALSTGRAMLWGLDAAGGTQLLGPAYHDWISLAPYGLLAAGAVVIAIRRPRILRARSWWWTAIPVAALVLTHAPGVREYGETWQLARAGIEGLVLLAGVWATAVARSPRWALAAAVYVLPGVASALVNPPSNVQDTGYWTVLAALVLAIAATAWKPQPVPERRRPH
ncbi:hypothetical protein E1287_36440 [Actinomadura sp. KC06]|uniref:hypothetical protein n=1 Tax=Actinomadura sp. KC06 TaxID=2530369 RepID=UPI00104986B8|nr:hypothetical protein [Actinomadura sp. KC06]TDD26380.1 hypothetical protein E1287_36440 [Actinomadura sp. KC06]